MRLKVLGLLLIGVVLFMVGLVWGNSSPDNELIPLILLLTGMGIALVWPVVFWVLVLRGVFVGMYREFTRLYGEFTGRTGSAAPAPPQIATQPPPTPAAPAAPVSAPEPPTPVPPASYVVCPWCGHTNPANLIYCSNGACLTPLQSGNRSCIRCGVPAPVNARFCPACGSSA